MAKKSKVIYSADGITRTEAQMRRSYNSYLKYREMWRKKGYGMRETMSIRDYTKWHILQSLKGGDPNIARTIARESLSYNATAAKGIVKLVKGVDDYALKNKGKKKSKKKKKVTPKNIYDIHFTLKEAADFDNEEREEEREDLRSQYTDWREIIKTEDPEKVFLDLAAAEIDLDIWELPDSVRDELYHDELKRFRERFEADLYGTGKK